MGRDKRRKDYPDNFEDMTVQQLRDELAYWRKRASIFGAFQHTRNRKECLKIVDHIEKLLAVKAADPN